MGKILPGPWEEEQRGPVPFPHLLENLPQDLRFFSTETRQALQQANIPFKTNNDINPIHCRKALNVLERLHERLHTICQSLCQNTSLAFMLSPSRYSVLIELHHIQENTSRLAAQLDNYRVSCLKFPRRLYPQRREIILLFDKLMRQLENIPDLATSLERDIEAQEQKLDAMVKSKTSILLSSRSALSNKPIAQEE